MVRISQIWIYPIKSCAGISMNRVNVMDYGLEHDRRLMVVDATNTFLSQRTHPKLALVKTDITGGTLHFKAPGMVSMELELRRIPSGTKQVEANVHGDPFMVVAEDKNYSQWFSSYLGLPCRLVMVPYDTMRVKEVNDLTMRIACHDSSSIHVVGVNSLNDLAKRLFEATGVSGVIVPERFRPNVLVGGTQAYEEDECWKNLAVRGVNLRFRKMTPRCVMVDVDPETGVMGKGLLKFLQDYRPLVKNNPVFGAHFFPTATGEIHVGDRLYPT